MSGENKPHTKLFEVFIKTGVDVNAVNSEYNTALHNLAMQNIHIKSPQETLTIFQLLVKAGALTNLFNSQGKTCLELFSSSLALRAFVDALNL